MDHIFIIFPRSPNTKRALYNAKYGLKALNKICGLNVHLESFPNLQHLHKTHWRCYQRMRGCSGMKVSSEPHCHSPGFHKGSVAAASCTAPLRCVRMGTQARYTFLPFLTSDRWTLALNTTDFQKNWECCQNQGSLWVNPIHWRGQQGHLLCFTSCQPKNNTQKPLELH